MHSLLYPNPVCMLTVCHGDGKTAAAGKASAPPSRNVMTISWLTCINNHVPPTDPHVCLWWW
jgi:hypothetical protein